MSISYTKLRSGDWGIRGPQTEVKEGANVQVMTKGGKIKTEQVNKIIWSGEGLSIASVVAKAPEKGKGDKPRTATSTGPATPKQRESITKMLRRLAHVQIFDSFSGTGEQAAADIRHEIDEAGGLESLTVKVASEIITRIGTLINDEM